MYKYRTEIMKVRTKLLTEKADERDIQELDELINDRAAEGWELVTYDYMCTDYQISGAFVITFRKQQ